MTTGPLFVMTVSNVPYNLGSPGFRIDLLLGVKVSREKLFCLNQAPKVLIIKITNQIPLRRAA